ncbi:cytochrome P450 [Linderina pennispora]|uniref:NADPH--hemoprotein reductase n=1 Tax=Linderina pennispora TaxID=61395 RepID=A0A1Y1W6W5_9FUNG|nr:cytochrome P450 [Linderina pennispora]ORX68966.1 cytochrome P450 [Linderina pennispora]
MLSSSNYSVASITSLSCLAAVSNTSACPAIDLQTVYIVVVEKGKAPETDGFIVSTTLADADLSNFRQSIAKRSPGALFVPEAIQLEDINGKVIESIGHLSACKVAFLAKPVSVREAPLVPGYPLIGALPRFMRNFREGLSSMHDSHGDTVQLYIFSQRFFVTRDPTRAEEQPFAELQELGGKGLFTTTASDPAWQLAHRLLLPAFSASAMRIYSNKILMVAEEASSWLNPRLNEPFTVVDFTTNMTFQTIGIVGFGYDFHLLDPTYTEKHPFLYAMNFCLGEIQKRFKRTSYWKMLPTRGNYEYKKQMQVMRRRICSASCSMRVLLMRTGNLVGLDDANIFDQIITLGIAGSETSAVTLSWVLYLLLADTGIKPGQPISVKEANSLKYLTQVIKETLRLYPPVPSINKYCGFQVKRGQVSPDVYKDPHRFDPDRFSDENMKLIPESAWLPFSAGQRSCIGFQLAMIEMRIILARLLSNYEFCCIDDVEAIYDPQSITTKPLNLVMAAHKRINFPAPGAETFISDSTHATAPAASVSKISAPVVVTNSDELPRVSILFGSNMGVSEEYAAQLSEQVVRMGFEDTSVQALDDWDILSAKAAGGKRTLAIVITSTYNGLPPDNATQFAKSLDGTSQADLLHGVDYVVFGCGNSLWRTYQKFPRHIHKRLGMLGATPLSEFQFGNSNDDLDEDFLQWSLRICALVTDHYGSGTEGLVEAVSAPNLVGGTAAPFRIASENASIKINQELQDVSKSGRSTRHIEIVLDQSSGIQYQTANKPGVVHEVAAILGMDIASVLKIEQVSNASRFSRSAAAAIQGATCSVSDALQYVCDWKEAPSRELVVALDEVAGDDAAYNVLRKAADDVNTLGKQSLGWSEFISQTRTVLDVPFGSILHFVSAMAPRRYSIAIHLSVAIVDDIINGRLYGGLATEYLASLESGSRLSSAFHLPSSSAIPVLFIGAGTGIASFRGFLQEMNHTGTGDATLYFGCRSPEYDYLYKDELEQYIQSGTLAKLPACVFRVLVVSTSTCRHHISADAGGRIYVCGSADKLAKDVVRTMVDVFQTHGHLSSADASKYLADLVAANRYVEDVW